MVTVDDRNVEGVEMGVTLTDLDSSCLGGLSEGEGSAVECSLTQHGLPFDCNWLYCSCLYTSILLCASDRIGSIFHGIMDFGRMTGQLLLWTFNGQCRVDRF